MISTSEGQSVDVILPAFRKEEVISEVLSSVKRSLEKVDLDVNIIVVVDGEWHETVETLQALEVERLTVVRHDVNQGKGAALKTGLSHSRAEYVAFMDADLDLPAEGLANCINKLLSDESFDGVVGSKQMHESWRKYPLRRRILSRVYSKCSRLLTRVNLSDTQTGIKVFRGKPLREFGGTVVSNGFTYDLELLMMCEQKGLKLSEYPVEIQGNSFSTINLKSGLKAFFDLLRLSLTFRLRMKRGLETSKNGQAPLRRGGSGWKEI